MVDVPVTASVGVADPERTTLFTEVGTMAPAIIVNAGVAPPLEVPLNPLAVATDTAVRVPPPAGVANVPSPLKKVVVLLGGVGTAPPIVAVIAGKSELKAMLGTPVPVVFFNKPVPKLESNVLLIRVTVEAAVTLVVPSNSGDV